MLNETKRGVVEKSPEKIPEPVDKFREDFGNLIRSMLTYEQMMLVRLSSFDGLYRANLVHKYRQMINRSQESVRSAMNALLSVYDHNQEAKKLILASLREQVTVDNLTALTEMLFSVKNEDIMEIMDVVEANIVKEGEA